MARNFLDEIADKLGVDETVECDNVVKWDGEALYVEDRFYRGGRFSRVAKRDVTSEIAAWLLRHRR
jgi:hypothetical protein